MGMAKIVAVALLVAAPVFADSVVTYELLLGGDNSADAIKGGVRTLYAGGNPANGQTYAPGVLNWAATVAVAGNHNQPGHPSNGLATQGVANFVFSVELHSGSAAGPLVTTADFYSSVHDGTGALDCLDCKGGGGICAGSAFAFSYSLSGWGPARAFEAFEFGVFGGPHLDVCMYPTVQPGKILGTGAGYAQWCRGSACGLGSVTTKGIGIPTASGGLGVVPVVEGQIDTSGLADGTYVLVLVPGTGTNVLRGDKDLVTAPSPGNPQIQAFAVAANQTVPDNITFTISAPIPCDPPIVTAAVSRKAHGGAGSFDVDVAAAAAVESRSGGPTQLVVTFDQAIQGAGGSLDNSDVQVTSGSVTGVSANGSVLTVDLTGVATASTLTVGFAGIECLGGGATSASTLCFRALAGDADASAAVNIFDLIAIRNVLNQTVTAGNFTKDVNADGLINIFDLIATRNVLNTTVGVCP